MEFVSTSTPPAKHFTRSELLDPTNQDASDSFWSYRFIADAVPCEWITNPQMRLPHSLSPLAFVSIHDKLQHLLTVRRLGNIPTGYLHAYALIRWNGSGGGQLPQSVYAALSIYCFTVMLRRHVDISALERLISLDAEIGDGFTPFTAFRWLCDTWSRVRGLASPNFPLAVTAPIPSSFNDIEMWLRCLRSVLTEQTGLCWCLTRDAQDEEAEAGIPLTPLQRQLQQHELRPVSVWRYVGIDFQVFSDWQRHIGATACKPCEMSSTWCAVCGTFDRCCKQDGLWCCSGGCRRLDMPLDQTQVYEFGDSGMEYYRGTVNLACETCMWGHRIRYLY